MDKLTSKISTLNLERVRQIKSRLVTITGRVQKVGWCDWCMALPYCGLIVWWYLQVRDELEHLLDDDEDMAEMYLTEKLAELAQSSSASSINDQDEEDIDDRHEASTFFSFTSFNSLLSFWI